MSLNEPKKIKKSRLSFPWRWIAWSITIFGVSAALGGTAALKHKISTAVETEMNRFEWMVLVTGTPLEIDEVGRSLQQLPMIREVKFVSSGDAFERLKNEQLLFEDLSLFQPDDLPSSWRVTWQPGALDLTEMDDLISDTRRMPNVMAVAFDEKAALVNKALRNQWHDAKNLLSAGTVVLCLLIVISVARFMFNPVRKKFFWKPLAITLLIDELMWVLGYLFVRYTVGSLPPTFLLVGIIAGLAHRAWIKVDEVH